MQQKSKSRVCCQRFGHRVAGLALAAVIPFLVVGAVGAQTTITFPWDWHISVAPNVGGPTNPIPGEVPVPIWLWGTATMNFGQPVQVDPLSSAPQTFDLGPGGTGPKTPTAEAPPLGGTYEIPIEIVSMELHSMMPATFPGGTSDVLIRESPTQPSIGRIQNLKNLGDGTVQLDSFFDIFYEVELPQLGMSLHTEQATRLGMSFVPNPPPSDMSVAGPLPQLDILWGPTWIWNIFPPGTAPPWVGPEFHPWDWPVEIHGHVSVPEPCTLGLLFVSMVMTGLAGIRRRSR
jgi:hypothetical protein